METNKNPWPITTTFGIRERIDTNPDFQRPPVWGDGAEAASGGYDSAGL